MRAAQELLGAPTIGRGSARLGDDGGGSQRSQISLLSRLECMKTVPNSQFPALFAVKITENAIFFLKVFNKMYSQYVF